MAASHKNITLKTFKEEIYRYFFQYCSDHRAEQTYVLDKRNRQHVKPDFDKKAIMNYITGRTYFVNIFTKFQENLFELHEEFKKQNMNINENILKLN